MNEYKIIGITATLAGIVIGVVSASINYGLEHLFGTGCGG